jgi:hypothetical protein
MRIGRRRSGDRERPATRASPDFRSLQLYLFIAIVQAAMASGSVALVA